MDYLGEPKCKHKCPHKRKAEEDLTTEDSMMMEAEIGVPCLEDEGTISPSKKQPQEAEKGKEMNLLLRSSRRNWH